MQPGGITHKIAFKDIRNFLAGRFLGATRDRALLDEVVKCLFCRAWAQREGDLDGWREQDPVSLSRSFRKIFGHIKSELPDLFAADDELLLDPESIAFVNARLQAADLFAVDSDPLGDAYQTFIGNESRGNEGQFFTPAPAVAWLVEAVDPRRSERVIDPACGSGAFLSYAARYLQAQGVADAHAAGNLFGIEKDRYLARLASQHIALTTLKSASVRCGDSLALVDADGSSLDARSRGTFDVVITNPPFGSKIVSSSETVRAGFDLAYKWTRSTSGHYQKTDILGARTPPQILFLERILTLLKPGGRAGIVVPESLISSPKYGYVVAYLLIHADITAVVGMPESLFKTSGKGGTHTKTCLLVLRKKVPMRPAARMPIYVAEARWCGHDSRGNPIPRDDLPAILDDYRRGAAADPSYKEAGIWLTRSALRDNILAPRYYDPAGQRVLGDLSQTHRLVRFGDLVEDGIISYSTGVEVGKLAYGSGDIPFVRTSDLSNWEIKLDPKHCVSEAIYDQYAARLDVRENDILMVKDGTYLIGTCALISAYDTRILFQSHLYKIRVQDTVALHPMLLLALLSSEPVQRQIRSKQLTQDIIDSLGRRILDLVLPLPINTHQQHETIRMVSEVIADRIQARELARKARQYVAAPLAPVNELRSAVN
ncbi:N-6 DNA methylase [Thiohalocapsa sp. ML1]|uniref:N-6 DNA methylase n=1 Tax=Thiohalocapsa sp. ML1 TaxID=1431688 RepID=UPI000731F8E3|nr:N-6 DNA methylase [Thiohalocapsa sp. ML1]